MKYMNPALCLISWIAVGSLSLSAASLGEVIDASKEIVKKEAPSVASARINGIMCSISEVSLCSVLFLPDSMSNGQRIKAAQQDHIMLFIRGKLSNLGEERESAAIPKFLSPDQKKYTGKELFFHGSKPNPMIIMLNPNEEYEFAVYYCLPLDSIIGGKLLHEDANPFFDGSIAIDLKFERSTPVYDLLEQKGITNNPFDVKSH